MYTAEYQIWSFGNYSMNRSPDQFWSGVRAKWWNLQRPFRSKMDEFVSNNAWTVCTDVWCLEHTAGSYPCAEIRFVLQRDIGYYVIQVFVPSILTVMMSWLSFWINIESVPARINLGLLTVVTITYQSTSVNATLPRVYLQPSLSYQSINASYSVEYRHAHLDT